MRQGGLLPLDTSLHACHVSDKPYDGPHHEDHDDDYDDDDDYGGSDDYDDQIPSMSFV